ncbi:glucose-6-phosphate isomerase [Noviherbaspirillum pedocola]|uniref:Glucose-6-phosphate isomerase n=1 Tax=Noviherbaspirillum pedocola TaxID=2801341 RepID=A0A934W3T7_9BURK|nr:glucose-6-phosphate isomerase [Noviherbaspirillum pedocola]MBK4733197.1 glucose-6-phosphate isomerase [Noviherbaspirillum pedocola]
MSDSSFASSTPSASPTAASSVAWQALQQHADATRGLQLRQAFAEHPERFDALSEQAAGIFLDYSKNLVTEDTMRLLFSLARERGVEARRDAMFGGERINNTEDRAVLHAALRAPREVAGATVDGRPVGAEVHAVLDRLGQCAESIRSGAWTGYTGKAITDVVNIGIGGSYLGPKMVCQALRTFAHPRLSMHFVSNVDGHDLDALLTRVNPETTLFIIASKTFTTQETMMNAQSARSWFLQHGEEKDLAKHFVAVSTNTEAVTAFGIDPANMFGFWDWVGGRYSVWSAIGLPVAIAVGADGFREFLAGAHAMDEHFRAAPLERNLPAILALIGIWNRNFLGMSSISIAPYHQDLASLPGYLQQLEMESNGKHVDADGKPLTVATCPVIWGDTGTNGQHAYFQLLHQGTDVIPVDFIASLAAAHALPGHQEALLANCFAQSEALMRGKTEDEVRAELAGQNMSAERIAALAPHRTFPGNRPSTMLLLDALTPASLGALIALYEHKVFVQGVIWGVNSFDQWGVELGKVLAKTIMNELVAGPNTKAHDASTNGLIARARAALSQPSN